MDRITASRKWDHDYQQQVHHKKERHHENPAHINRLDCLFYRRLDRLANMIALTLSSSLRSRKVVFGSDVFARPEK